MINLMLNEIKQIAKMRRIKNYKNMSKERLLSALNKSESAMSGNNFDNARIKKIREDLNKLRDRFLKPKIKEIIRNVYEIENKKNLSKSKIKEIEQNLIELEESLFKLSKYYNSDDIEYKGIRDVENLFNGVAFNQSTDEDYYKPIKTNSAFNGNYIEYESKGDKDKNLLPKEYFDIIRPYLRDMINDHKTRREWKIQLTMQINFISSKDSEETCTMHTKSHNIEIMMGNETDEIIEKLFESLLQNYQKNLEESMRGSEFVFDSIDLF